MTVEQTTLWDTLANPWVGLHLPRFGLFLLVAIPVLIFCEIKRRNLKCTLSTTFIVLLSGLSGVVAGCLMINARFVDGSRIIFPVWYYPVTGLVLLIPTLIFIRGTQNTMGRDLRRITIARIVIFALAFYFAVTTILTPYQLDRKLQERPGQNQSCDPA